MAMWGQMIFGPGGRWITGGNGAYEGASFARWARNWAARLFAPNEEMLDLPTLEARCLDLHRNNPIAQAIIEGHVDTVIGNGLKMHSTIDHEALGISEAEADELEALIEQEWSAYTETTECDAAGIANFAEIQQTAYRASENSGGILAHLPWVERPGSDFPLKVQLIETMRLGYNHPSSNVVYGVELDEYGQQVAYWISDYQGGPAKRMKAVGEASGRKLIIHFFNNDRPGQVRGVPLLRGCIKQLRILGEYFDNELIRARVSNLFTAFIKSSDPNALERPDTGDENQTLPRDPDDYRMQPGGIQLLDPDEDVVFANPNSPNQSFDSFVKSIILFVGMSVRMPFEVLTLQFVASYSAARAALGMFTSRIKYKRSRFALGFCQPIYEQWMTERVLSGALPLPGFFESQRKRRAYTAALWEGPRMVSIDETKEVDAAIKRINAGLTTKEREIYLLTGENYKNVFRQRKKELVEEPSAPQEKVI